MSTIPSKNQSSARPVVRTAQAVGSGSTQPSGVIQRPAGSNSNVIRRTDLKNAAPTSAAASRVAGSKVGSAAKRPAIDENTVATWLGGSDLSDSMPSGASGQSNRGSVTSDDAILSRVADRLAERGIASFTRIGLDIKNGIVKIHGNVATKGERLLLMHILRTTPGVKTIHDGLSIAKPRQSGWQFPDLFGSFGSFGSSFSMPSLPSFDSLTESLSELKPVHGGIAAVVLIIAAFFFWPRTSGRPVAVYPLKGRVMMDGTPYSQATVVLHPTGPLKLPSGVLPRGTAAEDGNVVFQTFASADGAPEGEFVATVHFMKPVMIDGDLTPGPDLSPALYQTPETSPFRVKISREMKEISILELHKSVAVRPNNDG